MDLGFNLFLLLLLFLFNVYFGENELSVAFGQLLALSLVELLCASIHCHGLIAISSWGANSSISGPQMIGTA